MKRISFLISSLALMFLAVLSGGTLVAAVANETGDSVTIESSRTIDSMLFASGNTVDVDGTVNGNVYCAGQTVTVRGTINGDLYCAGQTVTMEGTVKGSVHLAGQTVSISGTIDDDAIVTGQTLTIQDNASIGRDLLGGTQTLTLNGTVARDISLGASSGLIAGTVGRDVTGEVERLTIGANGNVGRNVEITSKNQPVITQGGEVTGDVRRTEPEKSSKSAGFSLAAAVAGFFYWLAALLLLSLILALLFPRQLYGTAVRTMRNPWPSVLTGLIAVAVIPMIIILSAITVIGIPFAVVIFLLSILLALLSAPVVAYVIGHFLLRSSDAGRKLLLSMLLGVAVLAVLYAIPFVNILVILTTYVFGVGLILWELIVRAGRPRYTMDRPKVTAK